MFCLSPRSGFQKTSFVRASTSTAAELKFNRNPAIHPPYDIVKQCPCEPRKCHAYHLPRSHAYHHPRSNKQIAIQYVPGIIRIWHITRTWHHKVLYIRPRNSTYEDTIAVTAVQQYTWHLRGSSYLLTARLVAYRFLGYVLVLLQRCTRIYVQQCSCTVFFLFLPSRRLLS